MGIYDEHIREQDDKSCRACGERWPCPTTEFKTELNVQQTVLARKGYTDPTAHWTDEEIETAKAVIEKQRETKRRLEAKLERQRLRTEAHKKLLCSLTWQTADGRFLAVKEMTPNHALNTLRMLESGRHPAGRWAIEQAWEAEGAVAPGHTEASYMRFGTWPLTEALWKRSQERPTILERVDDYRSARKFRKRQ
jgi:hypothetical protein